MVARYVCTRYNTYICTSIHPSTYIHTYIHTYIAYTHTHTSIHTSIHTYRQTDRRADRQTDRQTQVKTRYHLYPCYMSVDGQLTNSRLKTSPRPNKTVDVYTTLGPPTYAGPVLVKGGVGGPGGGAGRGRTSPGQVTIPPP